MQFTKQFNSSGPNIPAEYYTLNRVGLMVEGKKMVYDVRYITGVMQGAVSPFNINEELEVPYFTQEEMLELLEMHEIETTRLGKPQIFSEM
jgi:hypothetical protein